MLAFRFRLERVLEWRKKKSHLEESRLAACLALVHETEQKLAHLRAERRHIERELLDHSSIPAAEFANLGCYRLHAARREGDLAEERRQRLESASEQRARVQQARRNVKLLEKMRERRLEEYSIQASRELEQTAGESHLTRWWQSLRASDGIKSDRHP